MARLAEFVRARAQETYPEPPSEGHDEITRKVLPEVTARLDDGWSVLDVGCGQGVALEEFQSRGYVVTGTTLNDNDLAILRAKGFEDVLLCDMHEMPEDWTGRYDLVWARHVLEHSVAPFFVLHEFHRVLKPAAWLYVEVPGPDTECNHEANQNHYSVLGQRAWLCLLHRAGFEVLEGREMKLMTGAGPDVYFGWVCRKQ